MLLTRALSGTPLDGVSKTSMDPADRVAAAEAFGDVFGLAAALVAVTVLVSFALPDRRGVPQEREMWFSLSPDATAAIRRQADEDRSGLSTPAASGDIER